MIIRRFILGIFLIFTLLNKVEATHIRAGEITLSQLNATTYQITLTIYANSGSPQKDDFATINFGDGTSQNVYFNNSEVVLSPDTYKRTYIVNKSFSGNGVFIVSYTEFNRNANILNIANSVNTPFYVETYVFISPFLGNNNPVQFSIPPIDNAAVGEVFVHNPGAYDPDGDSLSFKLVTPKSSVGVSVNGYFEPTASTSFSLNPITGDLIWDAPVTPGLYNIAFIVEEWRKGADGTYSRISYVTRDMQINVIPSTNNPPVLTIPADTCIAGGTSLAATITAIDPDNHPIHLTAIPPTHFSASNPQPSPATGNYLWNTSCAEIREQPYLEVFRAEDVFPSFSLTDYKTWQIKLIGPAPTGLTGNQVGKAIALSWDLYSCQNAEKIEIYRLQCDSVAYIQPACASGLMGFPGYTKIGEVPISATSFIDNNGGVGLLKGIDYCYLLVAKFPLPDGGDSYASTQFCTGLNLDAPILHTVSVLSTSATGSVQVDWHDPLVSAAPLPYAYNIYRATLPSGVYGLIASGVTAPYTDAGINTVSQQYSYKVELIGGQISDSASTIALSTIPSNQAMTLNWNAAVPWNVDSVTVYRNLNNTGYVKRITLLGDPQTYFDDENLQNCDTVCYQVFRHGKFCNLNYPNTNTSYSTISCGSPLDDRTPPAPVLLVNGCNGDINDFTNELSWTSLSDPNCNTISFYTVYFSNYENELSVRLANTPFTQTNYSDTKIESTAGCYTVTATNYKGLEGPPSNKVCVDDCIYFELPNLVSPNGDSLNDLFKSFPIPRGVKEVQFKVFNRWGGLVFDRLVTDQINWDSRDSQGVPVTDGVYYYSAKIYFYRRQNKTDEIKTMKGWIHIIDSHNGELTE